MPYHLLADGVVVVHLAFVAFVVCGGFLAWRWRWLLWLQIPAALWGAVVEIVGLPCPLTPLEVALRRAGGAAGYSGGFVEHYLLPVLYPALFPRGLQLALGAGVVVINATAYALLLRRRLRGKGPPGEAHAPRADQSLPGGGDGGFANRSRSESNSRVAP